MVIKRELTNGLRILAKDDDFNFRKSSTKFPICLVPLLDRKASMVTYLDALFW